jgi:hypothetical protein
MRSTRHARRCHRHAPELVAAALLLCGSASAADWGVNVYGLSYHWDRNLAERNDWDNEFNPGLGLRYRMGHWLRADAILDGGAYYDSGRNTAVYAGAGLLWPLDRSRRVHLGAVLTAFHSDTYNRGDAFVAPIPLLTVRFDPVTLNFTHFPKIGDFNDIHTTALFFTFPLH